MAAFCGHSYGGGTLQRVYDTVQSNFLIINFMETLEIITQKSFRQILLETFVVKLEW